jgi:hypothetical protein
MKPKTKYKNPNVGYVTIKTFPHYGEKAVLHKGTRVNSDGEVEKEFIMLDCVHGEHIVWLKRTDI